MRRLEGKTAMITGCNRGIGKAMAEKFALEGANLICAIRKENLEFRAEANVWADKYGVNIDFVYFDLADEDSIKTAFKALQKEKRTIDVLVNNAGQKHGSIVNMGSVTALDNQGGWTAYGSSKGAFLSFTRTAARELASFGIRVNAVAPGLIDTEMGGEMDEKYQADMLARADLGRKGTPEEVANVVCFLASDEASYITGQVIRIDGGM